MGTNELKFKLYFFIIGAFFICVFSAQTKTHGQGVKRVVIVKVDGLPHDYIDRYVRERNAETGKSRLPWFDEIFYKNGTRLTNFYSRGVSLSAPSWSLLDSGQHLQIKGNVEYDRLTARSYDYLDFIPYYVKYGLNKRVDMPGVELFDRLNTPILADAFPFERRYTSFQLFQRGTDWRILANGLVNLFPKNPAGLIDEWTIGFDFFDTTVDQHERDIIDKLKTRSDIDYFDYYSVNFDHVSHLNNSSAARLDALRELDRTIGRIWTAIEASPRAAETALALVSDHGSNSDEQIYSQGFNLVKLLGSADGGGHHVVTKRRLMLDYSIKGINPFVPLVVTGSENSYYLKNQASEYSTAMLDFDGNERASLHLRDNDLNVLHILLRHLQSKNIQPAQAEAATNAFFAVLNRRRAGWRKTLIDLTEELGALKRWTRAQQPIIAAQPKKFTAEQVALGADKEAGRIAAQADIAARDEAAYREYIRVTLNLLALDAESFNPQKIKIEDYIAKGAMGERNSVYDLQNYVVGLAEQNLIVDADGALDFDKSFKRVDYFRLLHSQTVRNNVQPNVGSRPVDFVAAPVPLESISAALPLELKPDADAVWLYGGAERQALLLTRRDENGIKSFRYLPVANLRQQADGAFSFLIKDWSEGFPLKMFEDANLNVSEADKKSWLDAWHTETDWLRAAHRTVYSAAVINLDEQFAHHAVTGFEDAAEKFSADDKLIHRFRRRQRRLTETDLLILANNHWNFDARGFNSGGNHGSFFRVSANSALMLAGGAKTGIPRGLAVEEPYDSLSFMPTVLKLMGKTGLKNEPLPDLYERGFRKFPGRYVREVFENRPH